MMEHGVIFLMTFWQLNTTPMVASDINAKYVKPAGGIPETDLASGVTTKLNATPADATTTSKGVVQLSGDLGGTAASPTVPGLASKIDKTIVDAKGDLIVATAADTVARQAVGTNGYGLTADSTATNGVAWKHPIVSNNAGSLSSTYTLDFSGKPQQLLTITLTGNLTITVTNPAPGSSAEIMFVQDATGGRTVTVTHGSGGVVYRAGGALALSSGANKRDLVSLVCTTGSNVIALVAALDLQ
jgi:hypothetical protein